MKWRWKTLAWSAAVLYVALLLVNWVALTYRATLQTESLLDFAMMDLDSTLNGSIDTMLMHAADSIVAELGEPKSIPQERIALIARQRDLDEVNICARDGTILSSDDPRLVGQKMGDRPKSAEFLVLTNGVRHALSHPFRYGAHIAEVRRKYVGVAFPGGNGFVQVGVDESRVSGMFPSIMGFIFDEWLLGEKGFFLCADLSDGHLISNPARHRDEAQFLSETGYAPADPSVHEDGRTTFRHRLFGDVCDCRAVIFCGHRIIAALPLSEYYTTRTFYASVMALILAVVLVVFVLLVRRIDISSVRLRAFYAAEDARRAKEYAIAATIQNSALPRPLPESDSFALAAAMHPAREVGGDFYDYFILDVGHVAFLVADVSGKGVSAALYMMTAKTLIKDTLMAVRDPAVALTKANAALCRNNPANMFLTAWVGVLDLESGVVTFANAGHNQPARIAAGGAEFVMEMSGPVLAFMEDVQYKSFTLTLAPGDVLFLYTDGVTEALDAKGSLFGMERLADALAAGEPKPQALCEAVRDAVAAFANGEQQADDITVLAVMYSASPRSFLRAFSPTQDGIAAASEYLDEVLDTLAEGGRKTGDDWRIAAVGPSLHIILDEICSNIVRHSGASGFEVGVDVSDNTAEITMTFSDDGVAYDPLAHPDPDTTIPAEDRPIGGLGILMVKKMSSSMTYKRTKGKNVLAVGLRLGTGPRAGEVG